MIKIEKFIIILSYYLVSNQNQNETLDESDLFDLKSTSPLSTISTSSHSSASNSMKSSNKTIGKKSSNKKAKSPSKSKINLIVTSNLDLNDSNYSSLTSNQQDNNCENSTTNNNINNNNNNNNDNNNNNNNVNMDFINSLKENLIQVQFLQVKLSNFSVCLLENI